MLSNSFIGPTPLRLQEVEIPLLSPDDCREKLGPRTISDNMICAGQPQGGLDSCQVRKSKMLQERGLFS